MKLNLLPQTVSKGRALKSAWVIGVLIMLGSIGAAMMMSITAHASLAAAQTSVTDQAQPAADAVATAANADQVVASAADVIRDANLSKAMIDHNDVYANLFHDVNRYIPSFFRINSESAAPADATTSTVTLTGTLGSYQQYSDVILSLMRFKDAKSISRSGYVYDPTIVPNLSPDDPAGTPRKQDAAPIPTDQLERLAYYQNLAHPAGYAGVGNFGSGGNEVRGAMPGESLVTIVLTVSRDLQTPDPEATLMSAGSAAAAPAGGPPGMAGGFPGGGPPGGFPGGPGGPMGAGAPGGPPVGAGGGGGAGPPEAGSGSGKAKDDSD